VNKKTVTIPKTYRRATFWKEYLLFFFLIAIVIAIGLIEFLQIQMYWEQYTHLRALFIVGNIMFLALLCALLFSFWRKRMAGNAIEQFVEATNEIASGNFDVRIKHKNENPARWTEIDLIIENINRMAEDLAGIETLRSDFVSNVSHELKTPLATMQNYATLLQMPDLSAEEQKEYTDAIVMGSRRLSELITNILRLNKLENQQIFPKAQNFDLSEQLTESLLQFEDVWEQKQIDLNAEIDERVCVTADEELLKIVWNNLLSNAMKFTPEGGVISVYLKEIDGNAVIRVADTGCGMDEQTVTHIFEKFYQADSSHATPGNGLGLALVQRILNIVGGSIRVQSKPEEGSVFTVVLPLEQES